MADGGGLWLQPLDPTDNWASKAVLGERVWLNRKNVPVPKHHRSLPHLLSGIAAFGAAVVVWGVAVLALWPTVLGTVLVYFAKLWFLDRMVWLYDDMYAADPEYRSWLY